MKRTFLVFLGLTLCVFCAFAGGKKEAATTGGGDPVSGVWELTCNNDSGDGGTSTITMVTAEEEIDGEIFTTYRFTGAVTAATKYGVVDATLTPDEDTLALLKTCSAISFQMLADGRQYVIEAPISTVTDWGFHRFTIRTQEGVAEEHKIDMRFFRQPAWAQEVRFNRERLTSIRIQTINAAEGGVGPFDFKVWDIKLYP